MPIEREEMQFNVLLVGAGPANLTCAIHLMNLINDHNNKIKLRLIQGNPIETEDKIALIEKGSYIGAHAFSGAVMDPISIKEFLPDFLEKEFPNEGIVSNDEFHWLSKSSSYRFPFLPKPMRNNGNYIISISKVTTWMAKLAEELGVVIFPGFAGVKLLTENNRVIGVQTDDRNLDKDGIPEEPGYNLFSKITVLGEGPKGTLTRQAIPMFHLDQGRNVSTYELGCKEIWELPQGRIEKGKIVHTVGYPLNKDTPGGGFIYHLSENKIALGMVCYLSSKDPYLDPHRKLQEWKQHPYLKNLLEGGKPLYYGAKSIPSGGFYTIPKLTTDGLMILGDSANMLNSQRLKGIHLAMKSGILSAETIFNCMKNNNYTQDTLNQYETQFKQSWAYKELYNVRNFTQAMDKGFPIPAIFHLGFQMITGGKSLGSSSSIKSNHTSTQTISQFYGSNIPKLSPIVSKELFIDKLSDVYLSNTTHNEKQQSHIIIKDKELCIKECYPQFGSPCTKYCPAGVYEIIENNNEKSLRVNFANCVHCKAADMKCPFDNIIWSLPQGGDGPKYTML